MPVQEALKVVADTHILALAVPGWLWHLIPRPRARKRLREFVQKQVVERKGLVAAGDMRSPCLLKQIKTDQANFSSTTRS
ncbi:hypothetical protein B0H19DRAFT_1101605, partial [Mycena capillaripes]